jgi:hypothetical protein
MANEVTELERIAGIVMAVEHITFTEALLRVSEQYPVLRRAALLTLGRERLRETAGAAGSEHEHE